MKSGMVRKYLIFNKNIKCANQNIINVKLTSNTDFSIFTKLFIYNILLEYFYLDFGIIFSFIKNIQRSNIEHIFKTISNNYCRNSSIFFI
jgi:hypothetical protein